VSTEDSEGLGTTSEAAELEERWRRTAAELENVRKRCTRLIAEERWAERSRVAAAWLPVVDNLERALEHAPRHGDPVLEGVRAVREQAVEVLAQLGFARHAETAVPFDPFVHEAVGVVAADDLAPGSVAQVLRPGYGEGEHQLRPAAVVVAGEPG
jgi:molecular chaperone GrpE